MKHLSIVILFTFFCYNLCHSQIAGSQDSLTKSSMKETFPVYPGGEKALINYLTTNMTYADKEDRLDHGRIGLVIVSFVILEDGSIDENVRILQSVSEYYDQEAIRLIKAMPKWSPGTQDGIPVKVAYNLPIRF